VSYAGFGANNKAGYFNNTLNSYINIPAQFVTVPSLTVTAWIKRNGTGVLWNMVYSHPNAPGWTSAADSTANPLNTSVPATGLGFNNTSPFNQLNGLYKGLTANTGNGISAVNPILAVPDQTWTFVAMVMDNTSDQMVLYMNGQKSTRLGVDYGAHDFSTCDALIGKKQQLYGIGGTQINGFLGTIDEVAIYDKALTDAQIRGLYAAAQVPPIILVQPVAPTPPIYEGMSLALSVTADVYASATPLVYQWTRNGSPISGQTATNFTISSLATTDAGNYAVVITNNSGAVTSSVVALTTVGTGPPSFAQKPQPMTRFAGAPATFTAVVNGSRPLYYQWNFNNTPIPGATSSAYTINSVGTGDAGSYSVLVSNPYPPATNSGNVTLTVLPVTNYSAEVVASGPASYWRFNEGSGATAYDYVGGVNGTNVGGVVLANAGPNPSSGIVLPPNFMGLENTNLAYTFNGTTAMVNLPKPFAVNRTAYSAVAWVRADQQTTNRVIIGQLSSWCLRLDAGSGIFPQLVPGGPNMPANQPNAANNLLTGTKFIADGFWHQVAVVWDGEKANRAYLYVDGALDVMNNSSGLITTNANLVTIGAQGAASPHWLGDIDEVAVYNRALTGAEIANLWQIATSGSTAAPQIASQPVSQTVYVGQPVSFSVTAAGGAPYTYQWSHAGTNLPGATLRTLTIPSAWYTDAGTYSVAVNNSAGPLTNSQVVTLTVAVPLGLTTFANLTNDLVVHLKFDGNYADSSGRGNNGTPIGTNYQSGTPGVGPTFVAGKIGSSAVHVDSEGTSQGLVAGVCTAANYVTLGTPADLQFGADTNMTVAYWVKMPVGEAYREWPVLSDSITGTFAPGCFFGSDWNTGGEGGGMAWWISLTPGQHLASTTIAGGPYSINDGNWHHVVVSLDRMGLIVTYLDGVLIDSRGGGYPVSFDQPANAWTIGQGPTGQYWFENLWPMVEMVIDDMGIWRRALSQVEAQQMYMVGQTYGRTFDAYGPVVLTLVPPSANNGQSIELIWQAGTLVQSTNVTGPYTPVSGAGAPYYKVTPGAGSKFYRVQL
jgi:hypothetical protein